MKARNPRDIPPQKFCLCPLLPFAIACPLSDLLEAIGLQQIIEPGLAAVDPIRTADGEYKVFRKSGWEAPDEPLGAHRTIRKVSAEDIYLAIVRRPAACL